MRKGLIGTLALSSLFCFLANAVAPEEEFLKSPSFNDLRSTISFPENAIHSPKDLFRYFKSDRAFRPLTKDFTLMYKSECSLKDAINLAAPGILSFAGRLMIYTAGVEDGPLANLVNVIDFEPKNARYAFYQLEFQPGKKQPPKISSDPSSCRSCHGRPARPTWGSHPFWPGAFAGNSGITALMPLQEKVNFKNYCEKNKEGTRFQSLDNENFCKGHSILSGIQHAPNRKLADLLNRMNFLHMAAEIRALKTYKNYRFALAAAGQDCPDIDQFLPESVRKAHEAKLGMTFADLQKDTAINIYAEYERRVTDYNLLNSLPATTRQAGVDIHYRNEEITSAPWVSRFRYLVDGQSDPSVNTAVWSVSYPPGGISFSFSVPTESDDTHSILRKKMLAPLVREIAGVDRSQLVKTNFCNFLKERSLKAFEPPPTADSSPNRKD